MIKKEKGKKLTDIEKEKILLIKDSMNFNRTDFVRDQSFLINPNWFIGFLEGDGTFGIKNGSPYLQIAQKNTSQSLFNPIL